MIVGMILVIIAIIAAILEPKTTGAILLIYIACLLSSMHGGIVC